MVGIKRLAEHLNISIGTVSRALNGRPDVNDETRKRVLEAAAELGYVANQSGRNLRQGNTNAIGFMIESGVDTAGNSDNFFLGVFDGVRKVARNTREILGDRLTGIVRRQSDPQARSGERPEWGKENGPDPEAEMADVFFHGETLGRIARGSMFD